MSERESDCVDDLRDRQPHHYCSRTQMDRPGLFSLPASVSRENVSYQPQTKPYFAGAGTGMGAERVTWEGNPVRAGLGIQVPAANQSR